MVFNGGGGGVVYIGLFELIIKGVKNVIDIIFGEVLSMILLGMCFVIIEYLMFLNNNVEGLNGGVIFIFMKS